VREYAGFGFAFSTIFPMKPSPRDLLVYYVCRKILTLLTRKERNKSSPSPATYRTESRITES